MDKYLFTSERLGFRSWEMADFDPYAALNADPAVMEFFPSTLDRNACEDFISRQIENLNTDGFCFYPVDLIDNGQFIGFIGIQTIPYETPFTPAVEIGWRLAQKFWGHGYATEGAKRVLTHTFENFDLNEITAMTAIINKRSERVMQKIGMMKSGEFLHPRTEQNHPLAPHCWYSIYNQ